MVLFWLGLLLLISVPLVLALLLVGLYWYLVTQWFVVAVGWPLSSSLTA